MGQLSKNGRPAKGDASKGRAGTDLKQKTSGKQTIKCGGHSAKREVKHCAGSSLAASTPRTKGTATQFVTVREYVQARPSAPAKKTLWDDLDEIWAEVPDEELRKIPADLAAQHDHYLYGLPKKLQ